MDSFGWLLRSPILIYVVGVALALLLLYCVIRVAVARGLRYRQLWTERNRPQPPQFTPKC